MTKTQSNPQTRNVFLCRYGVTVLILLCGILIYLAEDQYGLEQWKMKIDYKIPQVVMRKLENASLSTSDPKTTPDKAPPTTKESSNNEICEPKTHVGFLKTHKTGSSTIFNILARVALSRNVPVVVPPGAHLCHPSDFTRTSKCMVNPEKSHDMLFNHVRFSPVVKKVLPDDSFWFTIIREPVAYFESAYVYFGAKQITGVNYRTFIFNHEKYISKLSSNHLILYGLRTDLGFKRLADINSSTVIQHMEENFDLVIVSTFFDHGLSYLKRKLCWDFDNVTYLEQNQRSDKPKFTPEAEAKLQLIIKQVIPVYTEVFQHFERKFKDVMKNLNLDSDVKKLRDRIEQKKAECLENENIAKTNDKILIPIYQPIPIKSYKLKNNHSTDCLLFAMPESSMTECLRNRENGGKCP